VHDGRVVHCGPERHDADRVVDATDLLVMPGMVDTHVHLMDPGPTEREDFPTGTAAAALAGVTTIVEHTHGHPVREAAELAGKRAHLEGRSYVDYGLAAHVWPDRIDQLAELWAAGVTFFKIFTCTTHGVPAILPGSLLRVFDALTSFGGTALVHCEDEHLTQEAERLLRASGRDDPAVIVEWRSREAELVAVATVALMARLTGVRITVAHVSSPAVADMIARERNAGADIAAEACPQYFLLREQDILTEGAFRKFTPPARARTNDDEAVMWRLLRRGVLSHVSTDHAPATREQKQAGSIWDVHFGLPGLDTTLPLLLDACAEGHLAYEDVVRAYAEVPARRYGLSPRKGHLRPGADADLVLVDPSGEWRLDDTRIRSKAGWTPYAGRRVRGVVVSTFLRGVQLTDNGAIDVEPAGRFLPGSGARL
jgi:dihydroorotase (multifunctional complex type)